MFRALYEYQSRMPGYLSFKAGDQFTILEKTHKDWLLAQNGLGHVGYVPHNYITPLKIAPEEVLKFVDWSIEAIHLQVASEQGGQYSHQQRNNLKRMVQHRSELAQELQSNTNTLLETSPSESSPRRAAPQCPSAELQRQPSTKSSPAPPPPQNGGTLVSPGENGDTNLNSTSVPSADPAITDECPGDNSASVEIEDRKPGNESSLPPIAVLLESHTSAAVCNGVPTVTLKDMLEELTIPDKIGPELVEEVRKNTGLSFEKSKVAVETVLEYVGCKVPELELVLVKVVNSLHLGRDISDEDVNSHDAQRLTVIFKELTACKDDSQQRSWALYEDEVIIREYLEELLSILENAKPAICRKVVARDNYDILHSLVQYYQMETRAVICRLLLKVFGALCSLQKEILMHILYSVLPLELAQELLAHTEDVQRICYTGLVMTMIFSTGDPVSTAVTDQLNQEFFLNLLKLIENPPSARFENDAVNQLMAFILSFNLHLSGMDVSTNPVLRALATYGNPKVFTENIMVLINRGDDPAKVFDYKPEPPNSVMKLFHDLYSDPATSDLLYTNDAKVLMDIILGRLINLSPGDKVRSSFLKLCQLVVKNSTYSEHCHRSGELQLYLKTICNEEADTPGDKCIAMGILIDHGKIFS